MAQVLKGTKKLTNNVALHEMEPRNPSHYGGDWVFLRGDIPVEGGSYDVIMHMVKLGYSDSLERFVQDAMIEKFERMCADYEGLGRTLVKHLNEQYNVSHRRIKGINDHTMEDKYDC